jgi:2,4-dihydroxyhept-2-ene-1,7-dioic acid aldolase
MNQQFRTKLKSGQVLVGILITLPLPEITEIMVEVGFDWLFVDMEHSPMDARSAQTLLQAAGKRCHCIIRVPSGDEVWIKKALDIGAQGVIVPHINTPEAAQRVVQLCKYPPQGTRSVGIARAHAYGSQFQEYVYHANERVAVITQVEHIDAVKNIQSIVNVSGIDAIFVGPYDLSASLGKLGKVTDPEVQEAIDQVSRTCLDAGIRLGIFGINAGAVKPFIDQGFTLIAVGVDSLLLGNAAKDVLRSLKPETLNA